MESALPKLAGMFYPLDRTEKDKWARIVSLDEAAYLEALRQEATVHALAQSVSEGVAVWSDGGGRELLLLFRLQDPGDLEAVRRMFRVIAERDAPLAYAFVHQVADGRGTWDIFHLSRASYLAHCNRVSGPGSEVEA